MLNNLSQPQQIPGINYTGITTIFLCHDGKGNILMGKRSQNCRDEQGKWDIGGGKLEFGLTLTENLEKEIQEEYCCNIIKSEFLGYDDVFRKQNGIDTHWLAMHFLVKIDPKQAKNGEPESIDEIKWFKINELPKPMHSQLDKFFQRYKQKLVNTV